MATSEAKTYEQALAEALADVIDVAIWMSGASAFAPDGEAGKHWPAQRERLYKAMGVLNGHA